MKLPRLEANEEHATGYVMFNEEWDSYSIKMKLDLLQDWIYALNSESESLKIIYLADNVIEKARKAKK